MKAKPPVQNGFDSHKNQSADTAKAAFSNESWKDRGFSAGAFSPGSKFCDANTRNDMIKKLKN